MLTWNGDWLQHQPMFWELVQLNKDCPDRLPGVLSTHPAVTRLFEDFWQQVLEWQAAQEWQHITGCLEISLNATSGTLVHFHLYVTPGKRLRLKTPRGGLGFVSGWRL